MAKLQGDGTWVLSSDEYHSLKEDADFLYCLEVAGVDNWEGYDTAVRLSDGDISEEDI